MAGKQVAKELYERFERFMDRPVPPFVVNAMFAMLVLFVIFAISA